MTAGWKEQADATLRAIVHLEAEIPEVMARVSAATDNVERETWASYLAWLQDSLADMLDEIDRLWWGLK